MFRLRAKRVEARTDDGQKIVVCQTETTWRELLVASGLTVHVTNLLTALRVLQELQRVTIRIFRGSHEEYLRAESRGMLAGAGWSDALIGKIEWEGAQLDSRVTVSYGEWVRRTLEERHLVALDADVYFRLKSDYARCWWPYIDSQPAHTWIDVDLLASLAGRDYRPKKPSGASNSARKSGRRWLTWSKLGAWSPGLRRLSAAVVQSYRYRYVRTGSPQAELPI
ncbi:hypothetical protein ACFQU7_42570 [Pseudoroseomonas wenyumeiae]